jgi:hypothetical protein
MCLLWAWWKRNDGARGLSTDSPDATGRWRDNLRWLVTLLEYGESVEDSLLMRAEALRELGDFPVNDNTKTCIFARSAVCSET